MPLWDSFARDCMEYNDSEAKFFKSVQVYLKDLLKIVVYKSGWPT